MKLLTKANFAALAANADVAEMDRKPVVKFFAPTGSATWMVTRCSGLLI